MIGAIYLMVFTVLSSSDQTNKNHAEVANELKELKVEHMELKAILGTKDKQILVLEGELNKFKKCYEEEYYKQETRILELTRELNAKSDTVAYLTNQLHKEKLRHSSRKREEKGKNKQEISYNSEIVSNQTVSPAPPIIPAPPKDHVPAGTPRRSYKRTSSLPASQNVTTLNISDSSSTNTVGIQTSSNEVQLRVEPARSHKAMMPVRARQEHAHYRPSHGKARSSRQNAEPDRRPPEDYVEFLKTGVRAEPRVVVRAAPEPLPPISGNERIHTTPYSGRVQVSRGHQTKVSDDVGTIIVSPLSSPEKGWRHRQHSQQQNGGPD